MTIKGKLTRKEAIKYLKIPANNFDNYFKKSEEIKGEKISNRWYFDKKKLIDWEKLKNDRIINLTISEYQACFEFAIKMVYGGLSLNGIRGQRTETQAADDVILGILAEHAVKNFLNKKFKTKVKLDESVHPEEITAQDIVQVKDKAKFRKPNLGIGIKSSKMKNAFLVLGSNEVDRPERKSDVYIFARVGIPSDHLFRILRDHSFFKTVREFFENHSGFKKISKLKNIPVWICGFVYVDKLEKVTEIPGQKFDKGHRYVKSVSKLHNTDDDWHKLISKF